MKTRMLHLAAALSAAALLGPVALAGQDRPIKRQTSGPAKRSDCCMTHATCKDSSCCDTKMKSDVAPNGKGSTFKKKRICTSTCTVANADRASVCRVGSKQ